MTRLPNKPAFNRNNGSKLVYKKNNINSEVNEFGISGNSIKHIKKLRETKGKKLSKLKKLLALKYALSM